MRTCKFKHNSQHTAFNKGCRCNYCVDYYETVIKQRTKERAEKNKEFLQSIRLCCSDCLWNVEPNILEFHHEVTNKKNKSLSSLINSGCSLERILEELDKGVFLCPTCHSLRHYNKTSKQIETYNKDLR